LLFLFLAEMGSLGIAFLLPGTRHALLPMPYRDARTLVIVSRDGSSQTILPTITLGEFRYWEHSAQKVFSNLAFYQIEQRQIHVGHGAVVEISIANASPNLLSVLDSSRFPQISNTGSQLVLSDALWRKNFHSDPHIVGRVVFVFGEKVTIAGVARPEAWRLPGKADAWLLETDNRIRRLPDYCPGFVVARMQPGLALDTSQNRWHMVVSQKNGAIDGFECVSVMRSAREPFTFFAFAVVLALLALPATTSLPLGEYPYNPQKQSLTLRLRRWIFLAAKLVLILPLVCFTALDAAQFFRDTQLIQIVITFAFMLAALRWMLRDQRSRCPVCLQFLRHPVHVGQPSRNFLAWNGTELICVVGHGFLHVPELPTSWFSTQRWLYLDPSWRSVFRPQEMARIT
jgi:hypothetical protein